MMRAVLMMLLVFAAAFVALWLASVAGSWLRRRYPNAGDEQNEHDFLYP